MRLTKYPSVTRDEIEEHASRFGGKLISRVVGGVDNFYRFECKNGHQFRDTWLNVKSKGAWCTACLSDGNLVEGSRIEEVGKVDIGDEKEYYEDRRVFPPALTEGGYLFERGKCYCFVFTDRTYTGFIAKVKHKLIVLNCPFLVNAKEKFNISLDKLQTLACSDDFKDVGDTLILNTKDVQCIYEVK